MDIDIRGLVHVYPSGVRALDGVDLDVPAGTSLAVVGQNGSGKTTLVLHLNGLLRPTSGRVAIGGDDASGLTVARLAARVGLAFQDPARQIFSRTVRAEVDFGPRNLGRTPAERERLVAAALEVTGLGADAERNPYDLGTSRRKLLSLASVLAMETPVVVLDEPTTGLDAREIARVEAIAVGLAEMGRTIVTISHDMRFVAETAARVVVMREGLIVADGRPADVFAEETWPTLRSSHLEPTYCARVGARLGLGSTPTDRDVVRALRARPAREPT